jgi:hypothetical protein
VSSSKKTAAFTKPEKPAAVPPIPSRSSTPPDSPATSFPIDTPEVARRGPGRPPTLCPTCNLPRSECKGHDAPKFQIGEAAVKGLLQLLGNGAALVFSMTSGMTLAELAPIWHFSETETALVAPPATEYINDVAPDWMLRYEKEFKIGFVLLPILIAKLAITNALIHARKLELAKQTPQKPTPSAAAGKPIESVPERAAAA